MCVVCVLRVVVKMSDFPSDENKSENEETTQQPQASTSKASTSWAEHPIMKGETSSDARMWGIVIGGTHVHGRLLLPQKMVMKKDGKPKCNKDGTPFFEYMKKSEIYETLAQRFATKKETMDKTDPTVNAVFSALKQLMRDSNTVAVSYHAKDDPCSKSYGNHYHIALIHDGVTDLSRNYRYRELRKQIPKGDEKRFAKVYCTYERIKHPTNLFYYMIRPPRIFYGTSSPKLLKMAKSPIDLPPPDTEEVDVDEIIGKEVTEHEEDGFPEIDIDPTPAEQVDLAEILTTKRKAPSSDEDELPKEKIPRGDPNAYFKRMVEICVHLMDCTRTTDRTKMRVILAQKIKKGGVPEIDQLKRYKEIMCTKQRDRIWENAILEHRCNIMSKSFRELMTDAWFAVESEIDYDRDFIPLKMSVRLLINWCKEMNINPKKFTNQCKHVLARRHGKHNTVFLMGVSNAGKTVMFTKPLEYIMVAVGRIASINVPDRFVFEGCVGQKLISIEECEIPKHHMEDVKKIMGGEEIVVQVKYVREGATLTPCPVIATSNRIPWNFDIEQEIPLKNRMYYYELRKPFEELASWENKKLDPRAYLLAWNTRAISADFDFEDLIDDDVLECAIDTIREKFVNCRLDG